ncbi:MAG: hypothetical protein LBV04_08445 [Deferribacteraceae bacterium]|jgi:hypothetical protein|nr:hypothetical protein [Deferribacteraceae bacterium]
MKALVLIFAFLLCACANVNELIENEKRMQASTPVAPWDQDNSNAVADAAFDELDNDEDASDAPATGNAAYDRQQSAANDAFNDLDNGGEGAPTDSAGSTGNTAYDRQQSAANDAFRELDCEAAGGENCSTVATTPETPADKPIEEKARPGSTVEEKALDRGAANYPIVDGYPIWFSQPGYGGHIGGVGIAKVQRSGGYATQRRVALVQAQADLARSVKVNIYGEFTMERLLVGKDTQAYYQEKYSSLSRQQVDQFVGSPQVMDEWTDEKNGDLYIWVVLPR